MGRLIGNKRKNDAFCIIINKIIIIIIITLRAYISSKVLFLIHSTYLWESTTRSYD